MEILVYLFPMMTFAPIVWMICGTLSYAFLSEITSLYEGSNAKNIDVIEGLFWGLNLLALLAGRYVSLLPGRYLVLPYKHYWLANSQRQSFYFKVTLTIIWYGTGLFSVGLVALANALVSTGSETALSAIVFLGTNIFAFIFVLTWPIKMLRPGPKGGGEVTSQSSQSYAKRSVP